MTDTIQKLREVATELDRLMLVIESAVRHADPRNHASVMALIRANKEALALPTAAPVVKEYLTVAATVDKQGLPPLPETPYQLYYEWPDDEDGYGGSEVVDGEAYTADQMRAYARAALSAGDAVDAQRYRLLRTKIYIDPKELILRIRDVFLTSGATLPEMLDAAIDAAMRKGQL